MKTANVVFAGTPDFAVPALQALIQAGHKPCAVFTQPDRPAGRGRKLMASPVRRCALENGIPVEQPLSLRTTEAQALLAHYQPTIMIVAAYGLILPQAVLDLPTRGCFNIHASILPRWRGAAPIQRAIQAGDTESGVSLMRMECGLDSGPVLATRHCSVTPTMTGGELHDRLAVLGAELLAQRIDDLLDGQINPVPQNAALATYADKINKKEAKLDWSLDADSLARTVRAFNPSPVAFIDTAAGPLRLWRAVAIADNVTASPGTVVRESPAGLDIACGQGLLRVTELQLPGRKPVSAKQFLNAHRLDKILNPTP